MERRDAATTHAKVPQAPPDSSPIPTKHGGQLQRWEEGGQAGLQETKPGPQVRGATTFQSQNTNLLSSRYGINKEDRAKNEEVRGS